MNLEQIQLLNHTLVVSLSSLLGFWVVLEPFWGFFDLLYLWGNEKYLNYLQLKLLGPRTGVLILIAKNNEFDAGHIKTWKFLIWSFSQGSSSYLVELSLYIFARHLACLHGNWWSALRLNSDLLFSMSLMQLPCRIKNTYLWASRNTFDWGSRREIGIWGKGHKLKEEHCLWSL